MEVNIGPWQKNKKQELFFKKKIFKSIKGKTRIDWKEIKFLDKDWK